MKVDTLADLAAKILQDTAKVRWTAPEHAANINAAIREVVDLRPDSYTKVRSMPLSPGTEQSLASTGGLYLVSVLCNLGVNGAIPGYAPRPIDAATMDAHRPNWRGDAASGTVRHYITDPRTPKRFEVWPPQPDPAEYVRVLQSEYPAEIALNAGADFPLSDQFINATVQISLYFGWQKAVGGDLGRSAFHRKEGMQMLGLSGQSQQKTQG